MRNGHHSKLFWVLSFFSQWVDSSQIIGIDVTQITIFDKIYQSFLKKKPLQEKMSHEEKHEIKHQLPLSNFFLYPGFILMMSRYLQFQQVILMKKLNKAFRQELSSHLIGRRFLEEKPESLHDVERLLALPPRQSAEFTNIFPDDEKLMATKVLNIDFSCLTANQVSALINDCREVKTIRREYKALVPLRAIRETVSSIYTRLASSRTCRYGLCALFLFYYGVPLYQEARERGILILKMNNNLLESFTGMITVKITTIFPIIIVLPLLQ
jgi:hypothetical protein